MKAAPEDQAKLLDLQACDTSLARLLRRETQLPERERLDEISAAQTALRDTYMDAQRALEDTQLEASRLEADVALVMERLHRDESKLYSSTSGKEASALTHELDTLKRRETQLEEMQFVVAERLEEQQRAFDEVQAQINELNEDRLRVTAALERQLTETAAERLDIETQRAELVRSLPSELVALYEQTRERYGIGAALLRGKVSEGSNMALADAELVTLRETPADEVVFCAVSGCILVRTKDSAL